MHHLSFSEDCRGFAKRSISCSSVQCVLKQQIIKCNCSLPQHGVAFMVDEVQTGGGATGSMWYGVLL